jgi:hypothetical protein
MVVCRPVATACCSLLTCRAFRRALLSRDLISPDDVALESVNASVQSLVGFSDLEFVKWLSWGTNSGCIGGWIGGGIGGGSRCGGDDNMLAIVVNSLPIFKFSTPPPTLIVEVVVVMGGLLMLLLVLTCKITWSLGLALIGGVRGLIKCGGGWELCKPTDSKDLEHSCALF